MKKILMVVLSVSLLACAGAPAIVQDKPLSPEQCFEGPFNIFRVNNEQWKPVASDGQLLFFLKNPTKNAMPEIVAVILHPMNGGILRYGYLDGSKFRSFTFDQASQCYKEDALDQKIKDEMKALILKLLKEQHI